MAKAKNILFIMCDQLRADYLSCAGHDRLETPNIDKLAERGAIPQYLLSGADLWRVSDEFLHGPLCFFEWRNLERRAPQRK